MSLFIIKIDYLTSFFFSSLADTFSLEGLDQIKSLHIAGKARTSFSNDDTAVCRARKTNNDANSQDIDPVEIPAKSLAQTALCKLCKEWFIYHFFSLYKRI